MSHRETPALSCPLPLQRYPRVLLGHGGGGRLTHQLIEHLFRPTFANPHLAQAHDGAVFSEMSGRLAFTTDSYVVQPLFFPGGNIGTLAVFGTVNDLAMCGARPMYLSLSCIVQEGLPMEEFHQIIQEVQRAAEEADVQIVTGDTKVVEGPQGGGLFLNTAGIGLIEHDQTITPASIQPGDQIVLSGDIGRHGVAIMAVREGLSFETTILSDVAPVHTAVLALLKAGVYIHCLRDLTRGGLATALYELATSAGYQLRLQEDQVPVCEQVQAACSLLGLDPLYVANEGRFVAIVPAHEATRTLALFQAMHPDQQPAIVGEVTDQPASPALVLQLPFGTQRILDLPTGEMLPRIC